MTVLSKKSSVVSSVVVNTIGVVVLRLILPIHSLRAVAVFAALIAISGFVQPWLERRLGFAPGLILCMMLGLLVASFLFVWGAK